MKILIYFTKKYFAVFVTAAPALLRIVENVCRNLQKPHSNALERAIFAVKPGVLLKPLKNTCYPAFRAGLKSNQYFIAGI